MCGIFALFHLLSNKQLASKYNSIEEQYYKGRNRGPEYSTLNTINDNILFGFHRLAINGLDDKSNQPIAVDGIYLICNGEIYNYKNIYNMLDISPITNSDCESIIHLYKKYGIEYTLQMLDGVFAFALYDSNINRCFVARDPFGVRPLYMGIEGDNMIVYASLLKQISGICTTCKNFKAGTYSEFYIENENENETQICNRKYCFISQEQPYTNFNFNHNVMLPHNIFSNNYPYAIIYNTLVEAVKKRVITMERNLACLLSGGLDSSLISALVSKYVPKGQLQTYSIGMKNGSDLKYAKMVAEHIHSRHTEVLLTEEDFFSAIPEVIYNIESYDTTTVRASVGNYLVSKYISENSDAKVLFNGDGSDELTGGYMYFHKCPSNIEFDHECKRLLKNIQYYDVLRSDRSISCHGLEARTPFLDRTFVHTYLSLPIHVRNHNNNSDMEKHLLRKSVEFMNPDLLPKDVLWRRKEAFSDGVSSQEKSWFEIIQEKLDVIYDDVEFREKCDKYTFNKPTTKEQLYYRELFEQHFSGRGKIIPDFWMPKYCNATDSSARSLDVYKDKIRSKSNLDELFEDVLSKSFDDENKNDDKTGVNNIIHSKDAEQCTSTNSGNSGNSGNNDTCFFAEFGY